MEKLKYVAKEIATIIAAVGSKGLAGLSFLEKRTWVGLILDITLKHISGKSSSEWVIAGGEKLEAMLFAAFGHEGPKVSTIQAFLTGEASAIDIINRYTNEIEEELGERDGVTIVDALTAPIPKDIPVWEWGLEVANRLGMTVEAVMNRRIALLNTER